MKTLDINVKCCNKPMIKEDVGYSRKYNHWQMELKCSACQLKFVAAAFSDGAEFALTSKKTR